MVSRLRRFFDVRRGEGVPVLLAFLYIAVVVAAFLLAKPIRNSLFLSQYGPYSLVYVYAAVPLALSIFVPVYARIASRLGSRVVTVGTLLFFSANVVMFWYAFRTHPGGTTGGEAEGAAATVAWLLPATFYVWVNCFGIIAPVQAWSFTNALFDTRQAKRLFGLIGAGASLGAITGGLLARFLVEPVGGTVNMMLVLAALILAGAAIVTTASLKVPRRVISRREPPPKNPFLDSVRQIGRSRYLKLMAALVFLVAIATQWTAFQLSVVAAQRFGGDADSLTVFFGTFNFTIGIVSFVLQLLLTGTLLRRFGLGVAILMLPLALGLGNLSILLLPAFWTVLVTNGLDQGLRFSLDKSAYELLYLPLPPGRRGAVKNTIDIVVNRVADAFGAILLGVATGGFFMVPGLGLGLRGTAAVNVVLIAAWTAVAWRLRGEYVRTIQDSIHRHRLDSERIEAARLDSSAADAVRDKLAASDPDDVRDALELMALQTRFWYPSLRALLSHEEPDIRKRALALLTAAGDREIEARATEMLRDPDIGVRTEALLYASRQQGVDPLRQIEELGAFEDFSIRAGMAAFLASPGPSRNLEAARALLEIMAGSDGPAGVRDRLEAARVLALVPDALLDLHAQLIADADKDVAREAIRSAGAVARPELVPPLVAALARQEVAENAADALARYGNSIVDEIIRLLRDSATPLEIKRELPGVLVRIGSTDSVRALLDSLLQPDVTLRHRVIASLNKLQAVRTDVRIDSSMVELALGAEIVGHYRSYQVLGPLRAHLKEDERIEEALRHSMDQELERIFRLLKLRFPDVALHDAYVGVRSTNPLVRANALEFLENVLKPELRELLLPLLDSQVTVSERLALADKLVGAPLETTEQAVETLLASEDAWLRSRAVYAVGALQLQGLKRRLRRIDARTDPDLKEAVDAALQRLAREAEVEPAPPIPADMGINVGAG